MHGHETLRVDFDAMLECGMLEKSSDHAANPDPTPDSPELADVLVPRRVSTPFTYRIPPHLRSMMRIGSRVQVPLGFAHADGIVVAFPAGPPRSARRKKPVTMRDILAIAPFPLDSFPSELLALTRWLAARYVAPWGQCLRLVWPPTTGTGSRARQTNVAPAAVDPPHETAVPHLDWKNLHDALTTPRHTTYLMVESSRVRQQVMLQAVAIALAQNRTALLLAPEVDQAAALAEAARNMWGARVGCWHGGLSKTARAQLWQQIRAGVLTVIVGTRSAVFVPLAKLGLVCVDDEDDSALKEEQEPRYHAREVAAWRAEHHGAPLLLGTSHPALETLARLDVERSGFENPSGTRCSPPSIITVDIRHRPQGMTLSETMLTGIRSALESRGGVVLFLNRKGFAPALQCRACGHTPHCEDCTVALTYYRRARLLACHYCGRPYPIPDTCPGCGGILLRPSGFGTEQLEDEVRARFAAARIARLDMDSTPQPKQADVIRQAMADGEIDVLIGTQLLFKGMTLPPVGFVGIPHADAGLHRPDFRAAERTYATLVDAVSLARPAAEGGAVVLQTYLPTHHVIEAIAKWEPARFYEPELAFREALGYPPFTQVIALGVSGAAETPVRKAAQKWAEGLAREAAHDPALAASLMILGPIAAPIARRRGRHRWQLLVKSDRAEEAREVVRTSWQTLQAKLGKTIKLEVDVDPIELS